MTAGINFIFQQDKPNSVDSKQGPSCREATVLFLLKVYPEFLNLSVGHFTIFQSISECGTKIGKTFRVQLATFTGLTLDCSTQIIQDASLSALALKHTLLCKTMDQIASC